jgi:hypothetical protein
MLTFSRISSENMTKLTLNMRAEMINQLDVLDTEVAELIVTVLLLLIILKADKSIK